MYTEETKKLIGFLEKSTDCFHAADNIAAILAQSGFERLYENKKWSLQPGGKYFVMRNLSSVIAFKMPQGIPEGIMIAAAHSDSPAFKIKPNPETDTEHHYIRLNTEGYGGMIDYTWLDRPLAVSGKLAVKTDYGIETKLVKIDRDLLLIPSLCIHMNGGVNKGYDFNHQRDLLPLYGSEPGGFLKEVAAAANVTADDISGYDLFLYNRAPGSIWGENNEYFSSARIDDLQCAYSAVRGITESEETSSLQMAAIFDNEEVGNRTKQGAVSDFLQNTLERIFLNFSREDYMCAIANGFMLSADNGHAVHPNMPEKSDPTNRPYPNGGIVIKYNSNQKYTTDSVAEALVKALCDNSDIPYQCFANRSDMGGGTTLGNSSNTKVSLNTADIGLAQLAMHSSYETAGVKDTYYMIKLMREFFNTDIKTEDDSRIMINTKSKLKFI